MTYQEAIDYIWGLEKPGRAPGLMRMRELMNRLGNPQNAVKIIHVAGTNGKGSVTAYLDSILRASGYRTGRFTSPDLHAFNERICIDGCQIPDNALVELVLNIQSHAAEMERSGIGAPTVFEAAAAMAFLYFKAQNCDVIVLETGVGGRIDATNIITCPVAAVITPIGMDHMDKLGNTPAEIASEKAGIIKSGCHVVIAEQEHSAEEAIIRAAKRNNAELCVVRKESVAAGSYSDTEQAFSYGGYEGLTTALLGEHQIYNAALAVRTALILTQNGFDIPENAIREGIKLTRWPGRFEILASNPILIVDGAHNSHGAKSLAESLRRHFPNRKVVFVAGVLADKDYSDMMAEILPIAKCIHTITPPSNRALTASELAGFLRDKCSAAVPVKAHARISDALDCAVNASSEDIVCAFGSLYYIGLVREWAGAKQN